MPSAGFWRSKPPAGTPIDRSQPLSQGLVYHLPISEAHGRGYIDAVTGDLWVGRTNGGTHIQPTRVSGREGFAADMRGTDVKIGQLTPTARTGNTVTWAVLCDLLGRANGANGLLFHRDSNVSGMNIANSDTTRLGYHWNNGGTSYNWVGGPLLVPNGTMLCVVSVGPTFATAWVNSESAVNAVTHASITLGGLWIAGSQQPTASSSTLNGIIYGAWMWGRTLSDNEVGQLRENPYQMFEEPVWRRYFIPPSGGVTGTGAITIGAPQIAGTGEFTTTGTGAISIGVPVVAGTGSFATTGTGAISIGIPVLAGTGTVSGPPGTGDITIAPPVVAGSGSFATTGSGAIAVLPPVVAAAGSFATTGSGAISIGGPTVAGSGSAVDPGTGSGAISIAAPVLAASGTFTPQTITGTGAITVGGPQIAGTGSFATTGTGAVTVGAPAVAGTGTFTPFTATGTGTITIPAPVLAGTGTLIYTGTGTITIPGPLLSGYSVLATRAAASDSAYGGAVGSDAAYAGAGAGDLALVGATASDSEV